MIDFEKELEKWFGSELAGPEPEEHAALIGESNRILAGIDKKQDDISLQVEEIYDIIKDNDNNKNSLRQKQDQISRLLGAVTGLSDMIEDFMHYTAQSGSEDLERDALLMRKNADALLDTCAISRIGETGRLLDPDLHTVGAAERSSFPLDYVSAVLRSGYRYNGTVIRKASVVVSTGAAEAEAETTEYTTAATTATTTADEAAIDIGADEAAETTEADEADTGADEATETAEAAEAAEIIETTATENETTTTKTAETAATENETTTCAQSTEG